MTTGRGRPRDERIDDAVLTAATDVLAEVGFEAMSIERVAARAGVGKAAIYRRWSSKEDLVVALVRRIHAEVPVVDTGNLREDLLTILRSAESEPARLAVERLLPRFLAEASSNPAVFDSYVETLILPRLQRVMEMIERAKERGEVRADADSGVVVDLLMGPFMIRSLLTARMLSTPPDYTQRLIDAVWRAIAATPD